MNEHIGLRLASALAVLLFLGTGCIAVSLHTSRDVWITVIETLGYYQTSLRDEINPSGIGCPSRSSTAKFRAAN